MVFNFWFKCKNVLQCFFLSTKQKWMILQKRICLHAKYFFFWLWCEIWARHVFRQSHYLDLYIYLKWTSFSSVNTAYSVHQSQSSFETWSEPIRPLDERTTKWCMIRSALLPRLVCNFIWQNNHMICGKYSNFQPFRGEIKWCFITPYVRQAGLFHS